jgi:hypothetical protein
MDLWIYQRCDQVPRRSMYPRCQTEHHPSRFLQMISKLSTETVDEPLIKSNKEHIQIGCNVGKDVSRNLEWTLRIHTIGNTISGGSTRKRRIVRLNSGWSHPRHYNGWWLLLDADFTLFIDFLWIKCLIMSSYLTGTQCSRTPYLPLCLLW